MKPYPDKCPACNGNMELVGLSQIYPPRRHAEGCYECPHCAQLTGISLVLVKPAGSWTADLLPRYGITYACTAMGCGGANASYVLVSQSKKWSGQAICDGCLRRLFAVF